MSSLATKNPAQCGSRSDMDPFPQVETGNGDIPGNKGDRDQILVTLFELLDQASPEVLPGHFSQWKTWNIPFLRNKFESDFLSFAGYTRVANLPSPCGYFPPSFPCCGPLITDTDAHPAIPSCDALKAQLHLTNICWTSLVSQALFYALGEKQGSSLGHSSCFQGIYRLRTYF